MPLRPRRGAAGVSAALVAVLVVLLTGGLLAPASATAPGPPATSSAAAVAPGGVLTLMGRNGYLMGQRSVTYPADVAVRAGDRDDVQLAGGAGGGFAHLSMVAPEEAPRLELGTHQVSRARTPGVVELDVSADHRGCNELTGSLDVLQVSRSDDGTLTGLAVDWSVTCEDEPFPTWGSVRWNSDVPYATTSTTSFHGPVSEPGRTASGAVQVTNSGTAPQTYGSSTFERHPGATGDMLPVVITADGCRGRTLPPGGRCSVGVSITSDGLRYVSGNLVTPDGTLRGVAYSPVTLQTGPQLVTLTAESLRGSVRLSTSAYNPAYRVLRSEVSWTGRQLFEERIADGVTMPWTDTTAEVGTRYVYRVEPSWGDMKGQVTSLVPAAPLPVPVGNAGTFVPVTPTRVMDTRVQSGTRRPVPLQPGQALSVDPAASGAVPRSGVSAVLLNVTGTRPTRDTYLTVWPSGEGRPHTSSVNLVAGQTRPNQVVVPVGYRGQVSVYNNSGLTDVVVDVQGYYSEARGVAGGGFHTTEPTRLLDTRRGGTPVRPEQSVWVPVDVPGVAQGRVRAVDVNLTVTGPTRAGHLTAWSGAATVPTASNVNFAPGQTVANHAVTPVSRDSRGRPGIRVRSSAGSSHVVVDLQGWYDDDASAGGLRFQPLYPDRLLDTRDNRPKLAVDETFTLPGYSWGLHPAVAHVVNVTAARPTAAGHLTAWSGEGSVPRTSSVNFGRGETSANLAVVTTGADGRIAVTSRSAEVDVLLDELGYFY